MKIYTKWAATTVLAAVTALNVAPGVAHAVTLLDLLRGGPGASNKERATEPFFGRAEKATAEDLSDPDPLPTISGPRYYTYKADPMRLVATAGLAAPSADLVTASTQVSNGSDARQAMAYVKVYATSDIADAVEAYYKSGKPLVWVDGENVAPRAKLAMDALSKAGDLGLDPQDYAVTLPAESADAAEPQSREQALMQFEVALSVKVLSFVQDTQRGRIDPNKLSGYHDFKRKDVNLAPVLNMLRLSPDVAAYLGSRGPANSQFEILKAELGRLRAEDSNSPAPITIASGTLLKPGMSSPELVNIVAAIQKQGSDTLRMEQSLTLSSYAGTQEYTPELVSLVEDFQKQVGLKPDGVVGQATIRALMGHSNAEKIDKLVVAMEQLRWLPADLGQRYVFINQPAYTASYFDQGKEQLKMRVVVGSKAHQTYFFQDQIATVEYNPYWGVPESIIVNEMLPKLRSDPSYLDRMGYEVSYKGKKVSSTAVNWNATHRVDVRQPPGSDNALGELKILFPNAHSIYMHDTPSKSFFKRDARALSHGCVRLAEPRVMAAAVLGTSVADVGRQIATGQNKAVSVPQKLPVYVAYFTAWPNKDGGIDYFDDVYGRDAYTDKALAAVSQSRASRS
ncbi:MAG: L,D-transpeptidase family protein [Allorhizobium sp.]